MSWKLRPGFRRAPRKPWVKRSQPEIRRCKSLKHRNRGAISRKHRNHSAISRLSYTLNPSNQAETVQPLHNTLQHLPQTHTSEPRSPQTHVFKPEDDTRRPEGPTCECEQQPCTLHQFPSQAQYPKSLDDLPEIAKSFDDRIFDLFTTRIPRWPAIGGWLQNYRDFPPKKDLDGKNAPNPPKVLQSRVDYPNYSKLRLFELDDFVISMNAFFAGFRDANPYRHGERRKEIRQWDLMWNTLIRTKRTREQWNLTVEEANDRDVCKAQ